MTRTLGWWLRLNLVALLFSMGASSFATVQPTPLSRLNATPRDPVYTVYTAPRERSTFLPDEGYQLAFFESSPLQWQTDTAGTLTLEWNEEDETVSSISQYHQPPVLLRSYADSAELAYAPLPEMKVVHRFAVYSSAFLIHEIAVTNTSARVREPHLRLRLDLGQPMKNLDVPRALDQVFFQHREPAESWGETRIRHLKPELDNLLLTRPKFTARLLDAQGAVLTEDALAAFRKRRRSEAFTPWGIGLDLELRLPPGKETTVRLLRGVDSQSQIRLWAEAEKLLTEVRISELLEEAERRLEKAPRLAFDSRRSELVYWQTLSFMQQFWFPAEGAIEHDYYVGSREPSWGDSREGQSLPESTVLPGFARLDPERALDSQRAYLDRQLPDGHLPARAGPYRDQDSVVKGRRTASPPLFNWISWELFQVTGDRKFLEQAYDSGSRYVRYLMRTRDLDKDGLFEWGGDAARESGRADLNVIWRALGNSRDAASRVEALDLNALLVRELDSLARSASELKRAEEAEQWLRLRTQLASNVSRRMWDPDSGFFYHLDREADRFVTAKGVDLRRMEIIGFLPLWAGIANPDQTRRLLQHLTDQKKFWRPRGVPSLAADDADFAPDGDSCCGWNGPVQPVWNYLVFRGLLDGGYVDEARELARRIFAAAASQLELDHRFWTSYHPDASRATPPIPSIGAGILVRMSFDLDQLQD